jgi:hypothetical protein
MRRVHTSGRKAALSLIVALGLLGASTGSAVADPVPGGTTMGTTRSAPAARAVAVPATATTTVRFCSPYDPQPSCADQTLVGTMITGFNFSEDAVFVYSLLGWWSLMAFDLPSDLAGATINSASLRLYPSQVSIQAYETEYRVNAIASSWNPSSITFNTLPESLYYTSPMPWVDGSSLLDDTAAYWDVTGIVSNWADGTWPNYGLYLWDPDYVYPGYTSWRGVSFYGVGDSGPASWKPHLVIDYTPQVTWYCNGLEADVVGTTGDDTLEGTNGNDVIVGLEGNDKIFAKGGDDVVCGGPGNDSVQGKAGRDTLVGEEGRDTLIGGDGKDRLYGGDGRDRLYGEGHHDILKGGANPDRMWGGTGNDRLAGAGGDDQIAGQGGDDLIWGQRGNDTLTGGPGTDWIDGGPHKDDCAAETAVNCEP